MRTSHGMKDRRWAEAQPPAFNRYFVPDAVSFVWNISWIGAIGLSVTSIALAYFNPTVTWIHAYIATFGLFLATVAARVALELIAVAFEVMLELRALRRFVTTFAEKNLAKNEAAG